MDVHDKISKEQEIEILNEEHLQMTENNGSLQNQIDELESKVKSVLESNAEEAIDYYVEKYEMLYLGDAMSEPSDNIIKLSDGYLLIIMYNTGKLTSESVITEIKIFNEMNIPLYNHYYPYQCYRMSILIMS